MDQHRPVHGPGSIPGDLLSPHELLRLKSAQEHSQEHSDHLAAQLIIDIRPRSRYRKHHIPGSHCIPSGWLISGEPPEGDLILVGESTTHSALTIDHLQTHGYTRRIRHLAGGFTAWQQERLPMVSPPAQGLPLPSNGLLAWILQGLPGSGLRGSRCRA